jgi:hypothetical protein
MAQMAIPLNAPTTARIRAMWIPREHGAWGMLLVPLVTGALVGRNTAGYGALAWFTLAALSLFWLRTPVESLLGTSAIRVRSQEEHRAAVIAVAIVCTIALLALTGLFWGWQHLGLFVIGAVTGLAFALQAVIKHDRKLRALSQVIGSIGLTSTAASAYYLVAGKFDLNALVLWVINWLFAAEQIEFVQLRIRGSKLTTTRDRLRHGAGYSVTVLAVLSTVAATAAFGLTPWFLILAFLPAIVRAATWLISARQHLDVHKLGWLELGNSVLFASILVMVFRIS